MKEGREGTQVVAVVWSSGMGREEGKGGRREDFPLWGKMGLEFRMRTGMCLCNQRGWGCKEGNEGAQCSQCGVWSVRFQERKGLLFLDRRGWLVNCEMRKGFLFPD
jgi:hypothetical protein